MSPDGERVSETIDVVALIGHVAERAGLLAIAEHSQGLVGERETRRRDARNRTAPQTARKSVHRLVRQSPG